MVLDAEDPVGERPAAGGAELDAVAGAELVELVEDPGSLLRAVHVARDEDRAAPRAGARAVRHQPGRWIEVGVPRKPPTVSIPTGRIGASIPSVGTITRAGVAAPTPRAGT